MALALLKRVSFEHPFKFGCVFSCFKTSFSDWLVQTVVEKREHIDWRRNSTFALFGLGYLGGVQYAIYVPLFSRLFPNAAAYAAAPVAAKLKDVKGTGNMLAQVVLDQFVHHPLMYFPAFYSLKEVVNGGSPMDGIKKYQKNYKEDLAALWQLWVPSTIINFTFMPMALRIPWVASTSLIWTCIISAMRGANDVETNSDEAMKIASGATTALSAVYDLGVAAKPAYMYDRSKSHMLVTASGRDRIGFISEIANVVKEEGKGNVLDVKAYKVGREFVTIMLVEADPKAADALPRAFRKLNDGKNVTVGIQPTRPWQGDEDSPRCKDGVQFTGHLRVVGEDQPGMLERITRLMAELDLDITSISCNQHVQLDSSAQVQQLFQMSGVVRAFVPIDKSALSQRLVAFEKETGVRLGIQETLADPSYSAFRPFDSSSFEKATSGAQRLARTITGK